MWSEEKYLYEVIDVAKKFCVKFCVTIKYTISMIVKCVARKLYFKLNVILKSRASLICILAGKTSVEISFYVFFLK